jgi:hypothetical protein
VCEIARNESDRGVFLKSARDPSISFEPMLVRFDTATSSQHVFDRVQVRIQTVDQFALDLDRRRRPLISRRRIC